MDILLQNQNIKVLTHSRLIDYMPRRPTHFVERMAISNSVVNLCSGSFHKRGKPGVFAEKGWKTKCFYRLPLSGNPVIYKINETMFKSFLKKNICEHDIVWAYEPFSIDAYKECKRKLLVYEMCDDTAAYFKDDMAKSEFTVQQEEKICRTADAVITISEHLFEKKKYLNSNFHVIRNGADYEYFKLTPEIEKTDEDELADLESPIVGYHGAISPWINFDLIKGVATELKEFNFVFIGRINALCYTEIEESSCLSNVHFLGEKRYHDLIHYVKYFDVAIIPFILDQLILSVNPIKMYEYLSAGKAVVSTPLPEVVIHQQEGIVETADNVSQFAHKLRKLYMLRNDPDMVEARMALGATNSWDSRYRELETLVHNTLLARY